MRILAIGGSGSMARYAMRATQNFSAVDEIVIADINKEAAKKMINANYKAWFIADDWVRYKRHANVDVYSVIPTVIKQNLNVFDSNLMASRNKAIKNRILRSRRYRAQ